MNGVCLFQYGLYASIVPGFLYTVFGTIKEVTIGPTAVNALISYNYAGPSAARALTLAFWTGVIQISLAFFQMGKSCSAHVRGCVIKPQTDISRSLVISTCSGHEQTDTLQEMSMRRRGENSAPRAVFVRGDRESSFGHPRSVRCITRERH